jgi:hypothetical protein
MRAPFAVSYCGMRARALVVPAILLAAIGCALLGFGPVTSVIQGWAVSASDQRPLPQAEVCAFGLDTICVRADRHGKYSLRLTEQTVWLRFRWGSLPMAMSDTLRVTPPQKYTVSCGLTDRLVLSERPLPCQPVTGH